MAYKIGPDCSTCHSCFWECPVHAIQFVGNEYAIDPEKCISCGKCAKVCPTNRIYDPQKREIPVLHARRELTADAVVLGAGGSGLVAAVRFAELTGKKVIVLEKAKQVDVLCLAIGINDVCLDIYSPRVARSAQEVFNDIRTVATAAAEAGCQIIVFSLPPFEFSSQKIADNLQKLERIRNDNDKMDWSEIRGQIRKHKTDSILDFVKIAGDETLKAVQKNHAAGQRIKQASEQAQKQNLPFAEDDNYYSILSRSFSLMLRTISGLQIQMYKPDVLVKMNFDAYGSIADYARGEEISELGRKLMADALDKIS